MSLDVNEHFRSSMRPFDRNGRALVPLDFVQVLGIPGHYTADPEFAVLSEYVGSYGMVTFEPGNLHAGRSDHPMWMSPDGAFAGVVARKVTKTNPAAIASWHFWLPPSCIEFVPYSFLLAAAFADYPLESPAGISTASFLVDGLEQFRLVERLLRLSPEELRKAHVAAVGTLQMGD